MKKIILFVFIFSLVDTLHSQQATNFNQFLLNDYGLNPAVAGSSKGVNVLGGRRAQWMGITYAPETNFVWITKDFGRKKALAQYWHGAGVHVEQDRVGIFTNFIAHVSYAIHLRINSKTNLSFGLAAGVRQSAISITSLNPNDPVAAHKTFQVITPNIFPGVYLYSKKILAGISVKNIYKNTLSMGKNHLGSEGSVLYPTAFFMFAKKILIKNTDFVFVPAVQIQTTFTRIPPAHLNAMIFYKRIVGVGISYKSRNSVAATIQFRPYSNVVFGFSYDFTTSRMRQASGSNATEFMFGFHSYMDVENYERPRGATACPKFEL